jgi:A/G-specific adenine glycosylase
MKLTGNRVGRFRRALLQWYDEHRRDLPWRETRDPYCIWLSEIMLQQTRVAAVLDHYHNFLERFPTIDALAATSEDAVLAAWSGLGYYRRARMLHQCAQVIVQQHAGCFPRDSTTLRALPGIGRYTSAAIASIAFGEAAAVVDGNVERVLRRLTGCNLSAIENWDQAQALLDEHRAGDFNQAMMELGATVCVPREPLCRICPARKFCVTQGETPRTASAARQRKKRVWCILECQAGNHNGNGDGKVRLVQRPKKTSLMAGMWELPQTCAPPRQLPSSALWRTFRHSITVTNYTVHVLRRTATGDAVGLDFDGKGKWVEIEHIPQLPITGLTRKILKAADII